MFKNNFLPMIKYLSIALILSAVLGQQRFYHETGSAILRVDEAYPGAFVEHRYVATGYDNLFRAFLAVGSDRGGIAYGSSHEYAPLFRGTFVLTESLEVFFYYRTIGDTDSVLARTETFMSYADTAMGIEIRQHAVAEYDSGKDILVEFAIRNRRTTVLSGLKVVFFYDGDVPDFSYRDDYPIGFRYLSAVGVRDGSSNVTSGFCGIMPREVEAIGKWRNWVDTLAPPDTANIRRLIYETPGWHAGADSAGDWSVFAKWVFPNILSGSAETLKIAFIVTDTAGFDNLAASVRGDSILPIVAEREFPKKTFLKISPNPFNAECKIEIDLPEEYTEVSVEIIDLSGRFVKGINGENRKGRFLTRWDGRNEYSEIVPNGIYFISVRCNQKILASGKTVLIK